MELDIDRLSIQQAKDTIERLEIKCSKLNQRLQLLTRIEDSCYEKKRSIEEQKQLLLMQLNATDSVSETSDARFRDIYDIMARNYQLEQTVLEMKQVLLNAQISKEISSLSQAIKETTATTSVVETEMMTILQSWYWKMILYNRDRDDASVEPPNGFIGMRDKLFYNVCYYVEDKPILLQCDKAVETETCLFLSKLSFHTRRHGICIGITFHAPDLTRQAMKTEYEKFISISSDLPISNIDTQGKAYLLSTKNPANFVIDIIWDWIDNMNTP